MATGLKAELRLGHAPCPLQASLPKEAPINGVISEAGLDSIILEVGTAPLARGLGEVSDAFSYTLSHSVRSPLLFYYLLLSPVEFIY